MEKRIRDFILVGLRGMCLINEQLISVAVSINQVHCHVHTHTHALVYAKRWELVHA
jgi:hypothetical protein